MLYGRYSDDYGLDGRGLIPGTGKIFVLPTAITLALGPIQLPIQWVPGALSPAVKRQGNEAECLALRLIN
jgi:hypothetical protein